MYFLLLFLHVLRALIFLIGKAVLMHNKVTITSLVKIGENVWSGTSDGALIIVNEKVYFPITKKDTTK
jgi:hypothetical protein